ncbi:RNA-binding protein S4 [Pullulanibacillus camelliae]|uniref:RNA-binding protein S4 n=1 Tax=Pullulanibacillus camelliae TaxID=1707096 RepID=A0A8J2VNV6_9BACL|nr:RNA-binding protein [Pullulanibacillus camelliae]GGE41475.1 RNA-binding protein S4 [Pullulanibacillus camelliae]
MALYDHFRPEEKTFIDLILEWKAYVNERYIVKRTDFLDPRQLDIIKAVIGNHQDMTLKFSGGYEGAERVRALLIPPYVEENLFDISLFELHYPVKFATIDHRQLLGALMGLGIKREKFGDLLFSQERIQFITASEIADFVRLNLTEVGRHHVQCEAVPFSDILPVEAHWEHHEGSVASLRLDVVCAEIYRLSRSRISELIEGGLVKVNWRTVEKTSFELNAGDYLSLRGFGRSRLLTIEGLTKRGNRWITYGILK